MSPKSRGRPKHRGRQRSPRPSNRAREVEPVAHLLGEAPRLAEESELVAQLVASAWLGGAWSSRGMGERDAEADLVDGVIAATRGRRSDAAYAALQALATVAVDPWADGLWAALARMPASAGMPWAGNLIGRAPAEPTRAQRWSDPWGSELVYLLRYDDPEPHSFIAAIGTVGGLMVERLEVGRQDGEPDPEIDGMPVRDIEPAEALADVADALSATDMYWPPQDSPDYVPCRALAHWRTRGCRRDEDAYKPISDDERLDLIDGFLAEWVDTPDTADADIEILADTFVDFGDGYLHGGVLAWSPGEVERFLTDWVHRKVLFDPADAHAVPDALAGWVRFALQRRGLAEEHIVPVVAAVEELAAEYQRLGQDGDADGPAKELMRRIVAAGVDPTDHEAVDRVIGAYNAEQNARRLLDS